MSEARFTLSSALDAEALAARYRADNIVVIDGFLSGGAERLHAHLRERTDWRQVISSASGVVELDRPTRAAMTAEQHDALDRAVYAQGRAGFQFRYETIRVPDEETSRAARQDVLGNFAQLMTEPDTLALLGQICAAPDIVFADAQATAYAPGDFLTGHDDDVAGKDRRAAYVFGTTPLWRPEWGGLLLFHDPGGRVRGVAPDLNRLTLFRVPQMHSVSEVSRASPYRRYSVTGWLRESRQGGSADG